MSREKYKRLPIKHASKEKPIEESNLEKISRQAYDEEIRRARHIRGDLDFKLTVHYTTNSWVEVRCKQLKVSKRAYIEGLIQQDRIRIKRKLYSGEMSIPEPVIVSDTDPFEIIELAQEEIEGQV